MDDRQQTQYSNTQLPSAGSEVITSTNVEQVRDLHSTSDLGRLQSLLLPSAQSARFYDSIAVRSHSSAHLGDVNNYNIHLSDGRQDILLQELQSKVASLEQRTPLQGDVHQPESCSCFQHCKSYLGTERKFLQRKHSQGHEPSPRHPVRPPDVTENASQELEILLDSLRPEYSPVDTLVMRESIAARRRGAPGPILEESPFLPTLNNWLRAPNSAICNLQHNLVLRDRAKDLAVEVIRQLVKSDLPTVWSLETSNGPEPTPAEKICGVLAYQLLELLIENTKKSSLADLLIETPRIETFSDILNVITRCFIVLEIPISNDDSGAIKYGELITVLQHAIRRADRSERVLKVLILTGDSMHVLQPPPGDNCNISSCKLRSSSVPAARLRVVCANQAMPLISKLETPVLDSSRKRGPSKSG